MADFLHNLLHSSQDPDADVSHSGVVDSAVSLVGRDDDVDYDALRRDTHWVWGSSYSL